MSIIYLDGSSLAAKEVCQIVESKGHIKVAIDPTAQEKLSSSRAVVEKIIKDNKTVYGINTGFGALSSERIEDKDLNQLQLNLIRSHCTGVGEPFSDDVVKAILILRTNCLVSGFSGITPSIVELLVQFINNDIYPVVPSKGSVGASGDLAPLSHIALALIGEGQVRYQGKELPSRFVLDQLGLKAAELGPKDGLALINGTAVMAALGCLAEKRMERLCQIADIAAALTLDSVKGTNQAYHRFISSLKPHPGQLDTCENLNLLLKGSEIGQSHPDCGKVQDPYSLRCVPQVHGACRQTLRHLREVLSIEINSVTDNPLIDPNEDFVVSGGNFHGEAIAMAMDYAAMGASELGNISERRIEKMMNPTFSELPAFLVKKPGLNSGLMIAHVTTAALASENKILCHPASVDSIPTSTDKEDHVSMGVTSGRKLLEVIENLENILAIEMLCSTQALDFQRPLTTSAPLESVHKLIRKHVKPIEQDRVFHDDITSIKKLIHSDEILKAVISKIGDLK